MVQQKRQYRVLAEPKTLAVKPPIHVGPRLQEKPHQGVDPTFPVPENAESENAAGTDKEASKASAHFETAGATMTWRENTLMTSSQLLTVSL